MERSTEFIKHNLKGDDWIGVVINSNDPIFAGRAQVQVFGLMDDINPDHLPWATPVNSNFFGSNGSGSLSIPKVGQFVGIRFNNGDLYAPEIINIQNIDTYLIDKIKEDYQGTHVILCDEDQDLNIIFQPKSGLKIFYNESYFQITRDSMITIQNENGDSTVQLEGDITRIITKNEVDVAAAAKVTVTADEILIKGKNTTKIGGNAIFNSAVLAEPLWALLLQMATVIDNAKLPITGPTLASIVKTNQIAATSTNVKISK